jgi:hypothetical protein
MSLARFPLLTVGGVFAPEPSQSDRSSWNSSSFARPRALNSGCYAWKSEPRGVKGPCSCWLDKRLSIFTGLRMDQWGCIERSSDAVCLSSKDSW